MADARTEVLTRLQSALAGQPPARPVPRDYDIEGPLEPAAVVDRFVERVTDYRATVTRTGAEGIRDAVAAALGWAGPVAVPADLDRTWLPARTEVRPDEGLTTEDLDGMGAVVTAAALGIAETGTIVLDGGPGQGRRALSLVPDLHVCVLRTDQLVATVPQAVRRLDPTRPQTWISGPSATSDIELERVEGVHGPRTLHVVLVG